jgi:hypothetical protein
VINTCLGVKQNMGRRSEKRKNKEEKTVVVGKEEGLKIRGKKKGKGNGKGGNKKINARRLERKRRRRL